MKVEGFGLGCHDRSTHATSAPLDARFPNFMPISLVSSVQASWEAREQSVLGQMEIKGWRIVLGQGAEKWMLPVVRVRVGYI